MKKYIKILFALALSTLATSSFSQLTVTDFIRVTVEQSLKDTTKVTPLIVLHENGPHHRLILNRTSEGYAVSTHVLLPDTVQMNALINLNEYNQTVFPSDYNWHAVIFTSNDMIWEFTEFYSGVSTDGIYVRAYINWIAIRKAGHVRFVIDSAIFELQAETGERLILTFDQPR